MIGRFTTIDPLAEKFHPFSPYNYGLNSPIIIVDPDGRAASPIYDSDGNLLGTDDQGLNNAVLSSSNTLFANSSVMFSQLGFNNMFGVDGTWNTKYFGMKTNGDFIVTGGNVGIGTTTPNSLCPVSRWWWFLLIIPINWIEVANFYRKIM